MRPVFSAYLDVIRFLAALGVFVGHAAGVNWTGGLLWQAAAYADTFVVVFFVLSGYVIAYVAENKERHWWTYGASRIARMWSVVIPALVLTFVIDYAGVRMAPELYIGQPWFNGDNLAWRYLASLFLVHETWHINYAPGINQPFWSLGYEAYYYLIFAFVVYSRGKARPMLVALACLAGGPLVLALLPVWMAGVWAYRHGAQWKPSRAVAGACFVASLALLAAAPFLRDVFSVRLMGQEVLGRYVDAVAFVLHLLAAQRLMDRDMPLAPRLHGAIRQVASTTFVLYLFHRPLMQMFSYAGPADPSSWERRVLVIGGTLAVVGLATPWCDRFQKFLRRALLRWMTPRTALAARVLPEFGHDLPDKR